MELKLYGIAIAAVPQKDHPDVLDVICTPVSVSDVHPEKFEILRDLEFKASCNTQSTPEVLGCLTRLVDVMERVVNLQKQSLKAHGLEEHYRPVALRIGQDSRRPVNGDALIAHLFGKHVISSQSFINDYEQVRAAERTRDAFVEQHPAEMDGYGPTFARLSQLADQCTLKWGSFGHVPERGAKENTELDQRLAGLKPLFEAGDRDALKEVVGVAKKEGKRWGRNVTRNPSIFWHQAPSGYAEDTQMQAEHPRYSYYYWHDDVRDAFYDGYHQTYKGPHTRTLKLPLDSRNPPFTDPCADQVRDQLQVALGLRDAELVPDEPRWRKTIGRISATALSKPMKLSIMPKELPAARLLALEPVGESRWRANIAKRQDDQAKPKMSAIPPRGGF